MAKLVVNDQLTEPAYQSAAGPITPLDILYGLRTSMARGNLYMAHRCGFTQRVLADTLKACGFSQAVVRQRESYFDLWALASKSTQEQQALQAMANIHFPMNK